jgi:hypothetical protein
MIFIGVTTQKCEKYHSHFLIVLVSEKNIFEILSKVESIIGQLAWPVRGGSVDTTVQGPQRQEA